MTKKLFIVESPAKAKTISKYLGADFIVIASYGHVCGFLRKSGVIDVENNFKATYVVSDKQQKYVNNIINAAKKCDTVYLATDPDREGEAISSHIKDFILAEQPHILIKRVVFSAITKTSVLQSLNNYRDVDDRVVDAQYTRSVLDYLIGFNISPLLWRKIKRGLSAGRVQSPALRLICEREEEIKAFIPEDYYTIDLHGKHNDTTIIASLFQFKECKVDNSDNKLTDLKVASDIVTELKKAQQAIVSDITAKKKKQKPYPPYITASLLIDAARKLYFSTDKTMKIAQTLYEGVALGNNQVGLITYMRTDSVNLTTESIQAIRDFITHNYATNYLPKTPHKYVKKSKYAQEAHEAIHPTDIFLTPDSIKQYLNNEQYKLYDLIWKRALASQLSFAQILTTRIECCVENDYLFKLSGSQVLFDGFRLLYNDDNEDEIIVPDLKKGDVIDIEDIKLHSHTTQPKPRYNEGSLIKQLEQLGIGRPSTYPVIVSTLKKREYVQVEKRVFTPTDIGLIVSKFLFEHFNKYVDYKFTAALENKFDDIANGNLDKLDTMQHFWQELSTMIEHTNNTVKRSELLVEELDDNCPLCNNKLVSRFGKYGKFIGCSNYPECKYIASNNAEPKVVPDRVCPNDNGELVIHQGKYGSFIACKNYPKCKYIENQDELIGVDCPSKSCNGKLVMKKSRRYGKIFYSCNQYPNCKVIFNKKPLNEFCQKCNNIMLLSETKRYGTRKICSKCDFFIQL